MGITDVIAGVRTSFFVRDTSVRACGFNKDGALGCGKSDGQVCPSREIIIEPGIKP